MEKTAENVRFTLENSDHEQFYCVLKKEADYTQQFEQVFSIQKGYGFSVRCHDHSLELYDYFVGEARAAFTILNTSETDEPVLYQLQKTERQA